MADPKPDPARTLQVFEMIDLPVGWARHHERVVVAFDDQSAPSPDTDFGWHARVVGDEGLVLLSFPWYDHADRTLLGHGQGERFPVTAGEGAWDDVEEGWWGWVEADATDVYLAQTDIDLMRNEKPTQIVLEKPGNVYIDGLHVTWSSVDRDSFDAAWQDAIASCRTGQPAPVSEWPSESRDRVRLLD